ncbi:PREDICTED: uncharacterized protein LOC105568602 [Vollenhovia emeryi]|uniref:uncharacterized protein LOC105568602 n=1 Tax=Vollenhovia emeryi TaxID=411798 RepID=UPI0005F44265|nr:PREDICTED: uncharacterized protein LOC105568602 [Vollenhovia emeryi]
MFPIIFIFSLALTYVAGEIPSYMHICGRKNPNLDKCIANSINDLRSNICNGIPELQTPPLEPFIVKQVTLSDVDNAKMYVRDLQITGLCEFIINDLHVNLDNLHIEGNLSFKKIFLNGTYDADIRILVSFVKKGLVYFTTDNLAAKVAVDFKMINKDGKKYIYMSKLNVNLDIKTLNTQFGSESNADQLNLIVSTFIGSNEKELINKAKPIIEKELTKQLLVIANNIVKHFTYDELFPDRL